MSLTTDRYDPGLRKIISEGPNKGQQETYLVLSEEERAKGFLMPVYRSYRHLACGGVTTMGQALCETYARRPTYYSGTFCCRCGTHFDLFRYVEAPLDAADVACGRVLHKEAAFHWVEPDGNCLIPVGATPEEAKALWDAKRRQEAEKHAGGGI